MLLHVTQWHKTVFVAVAVVEVNGSTVTHLARNVDRSVGNRTSFEEVLQVVVRAIVVTSTSILWQVIRQSTTVVRVSDSTISQTIVVWLIKWSTPVREGRRSEVLPSVTVSILVIRKRCDLVSEERLIYSHFQLFVQISTTTAIFGCNQDYTVTSVLTVKYCCRKTFQYRYLSDVVRIQVQEAARRRLTTGQVSAVFAGSRVERYTVYDEQWLVRTGNRRVTTNDYVSTRTGQTGSCGDIHTWYLTTKNTSNVGFRSQLQLIITQRGYRITKCFFLAANTQTSHNDFVQCNTFAHGNVKRIADTHFDFTCLKSGVAYYEDF